MVNKMYGKTLMNFFLDGTIAKKKNNNNRKNMECIKYARTFLASYFFRNISLAVIDITDS